MAKRFQNLIGKQDNNCEMDVKVDLGLTTNVDRAQAKRTLQTTIATIEERLGKKGSCKRPFANFLHEPFLPTFGSGTNFSMQTISRI
jgi:hypothetical protein